MGTERRRRRRTNVEGSSDSHSHSNSNSSTTSQPQQSSPSPTFSNKTCRYRYPPLWKIGEDDTNDGGGKPSRYMPSHIQPGTHESFAWARSVSRAHLRTSVESTNSNTNSDSDSNPPSSYCGEYLSYGRIVVSTFVIAQEFALSTLFLASHRCLVCISVMTETTTATATTATTEDDDYGYGNEVCTPCEDETRVMYSFIIFGMITLPIIAIWAHVARMRQEKEKEKDQLQLQMQMQMQQGESDNDNSSGSGKDDGIANIKLKPTIRNRERIYYRTVDAILIAGMLRFLSSLLRTLTASYSSDTVVALAVGGMLLHLLSCDYRFANGRNVSSKSNNNRGSGSSSSSGMYTYEHGRPLFMGGTISINSVFFSAVLLASRCPTDTSSYIFLMQTVILFAYYPEARHIMAFTFGDSFVFCTLFTTVTMCISSYLILNNGIETIIFKFVLFYILCIAPAWRWMLQGRKEIIGGPWEIAHLSSVES